MKVHKMPQANGEVKQSWYVRITPTDIERIRTQSKRITKRTGMTVPMAEVLRKCVSLGLAQLERGK